MVFNWFNRFRKKDGEEKPEQVQAESTPTETTPAAEQEPPGEPDYMNWAKRAYENMKRQEAEVAPPPAPEPAPPAPAAISDWEKILYGGGSQSAPPPPPIAESPVREEIAPPPLPPVEARTEQPLPPPTPPVPPPAVSDWEQVIYGAAAPAPEAPPTPPSAPPEPSAPPPAVLDWQQTLYGASAPPTAPEEPAVAPPAEPVVGESEPAPVSELEAPAPAPEPPPSPPEPPPAPEPSRPAEPPSWWQRLGFGRRGTPEPQAPAAEQEPSTGAPSAPAEPAAVPVEFDAGFLWSAEVLAAQGRSPEDVTFEEISWLTKLRQGLGRTRRNFTNAVKSIVGRGPLGKEELEELEDLLLQADVGVNVAEKILDALQERVRREALPPDQAIRFLKQQLRQQVELAGDDPTQFAPQRGRLNVWLIVGVNGVGKTTTIGKLAALASRSGYKTMIAAADTFRAAAVAQVEEWGRRSAVPVISNPSANADPAAVVFDAIGAARARGIELLMVDTAGRLQNKKNLMDELAKVRRIIDKQAIDAHIEALLVLDATTGQNGLQQAKVFTEVASLTGVVLTKLDGTAKGGIALAIVDELNLPIRFVGVGEKIDDLRPFNSFEFIEALLTDVED